LVLGAEVLLLPLLELRWKGLVFLEPAELPGPYRGFLLYGVKAPPL